MRFNISKNIFKVATSDFQNVSKLQDEIKMDPSQTYFLVMALIKSSSIIISDICEVPEYDNMMWNLFIEKSHSTY